MGGASFPPPRKMKARTDLKSLFGEDPLDLYLALGPLTNLARLEERHPGILGKIQTLWIPARIENENRCAGWNLAWDALSTTKVFQKARKIVLIDVSPSTSSINNAVAPVVLRSEPG